MWHLEFATDRPQTGVESIPNQLEKSDVFEKSPFPISVLKTQIFDSISANFQAPTEIDHLKLGLIPRYFKIFIFDLNCHFWKKITNIMGRISGFLRISNFSRK